MTKFLTVEKNTMPIQLEVSLFTIPRVFLIYQSVNHLEACFLSSHWMLDDKLSILITTCWMKTKTSSLITMCFHGFKSPILENFSFINEKFKT